MSTEPEVRPVVNKVHNSILPPAAPLVMVDPYFSLWSFTDKLNARLP
ncbi:MAG: DUF4964 domain-containing protein [Bacteroidales bacterium]|nr:DUF4964 domain-containing protein [Bacteroidales bacterium]